MRQVKIGAWPAMAFPSVVAEWEGLRKVRDAGRDPSLERKTSRQEKKHKPSKPKRASTQLQGWWMTTSMVTSCTTALRQTEEVGEAIWGHVAHGVAGVYNRYRYDAEKLQWLQRLAERLEAIVQAAHAEP